MSMTRVPACSTSTLNGTEAVQSASPPLVSVMLLVRDEAATLERTLESVADLGAEIVVGVDTSTRDNTKEIAGRYADRVIDIDFEGGLGGDFAAARNLLNAAATGHWGLTLDGHEYFLPVTRGFLGPPLRRA